MTGSNDDPFPEIARPVTCTPMISGFASLPHYRDHIAPIMNRLPVQDRGPLVDTADQVPPDGPVIVAGWVDLQALLGRQPVVYVEHGAGQTYNGAARYHTRHPSYSGSNHSLFKRVRLFICPNDVVAQRWSDQWPDTPAVAVGCPKLDEWHTALRCVPDPNTVAWTWHWGAQLDVPEAMSALDHYREHLPRIVRSLTEAGVRVLGHAHPRWEGRLERVWRAAGADYTEDPTEVFDRASVLVADNTSLAPEFASLNRPVVWLNAPWYRRNVNHGGRFWEWVDGQPVADNPDDVARLVCAALDETPEAAQARRDMVDLVYSYTAGDAAERAARAIIATVG